MDLLNYGDQITHLMASLFNTYSAERIFLIGCILYSSITSFVTYRTQHVCDSVSVLHSM
jgi:hypothetical protein